MGMAFARIKFALTARARARLIERGKRKNSVGSRREREARDLEQFGVDLKLEPRNSALIWVGCKLGTAPQRGCEERKAKGQRGSGQEGRGKNKKNKGEGGGKPGTESCRRAVTVIWWQEVDSDLKGKELYNSRWRTQLGPSRSRRIHDPYYKTATSKRPVGHPKRTNKHEKKYSQSHVAGKWTRA